MSLFTGLNCWDTVLFIAELVFKEGKVNCTIIVYDNNSFSVYYQFLLYNSGILFYLCILVGLHQLLNSALAILGECEG